MHGTGRGVDAAGLRHVTGDALDYALLAATQLDDVAIGVAHPRVIAMSFAFNAAIVSGIDVTRSAMRV